ncbi:MAG: RNase H family protein, partial [Chloroflexota bacterium]
KANKPLTQSYRAFMQSHDIKVHWRKVKSHTGVKWNEVADDLAKKGARS